MSLNVHTRRTVVPPSRRDVTDAPSASAAALQTRPDRRRPLDTFDAAPASGASTSAASANAAAQGRAQAHLRAIEQNDLRRTTTPSSRPGSDVRHDGDADGALVGATGGAATVYEPNAALSSVPAFMPAGGVRADRTLVMVNGLGTDVAKHTSELQAIADASGARVVGLHNGREGTSRLTSIPGGLAQAIQDRGATNAKEYLRNPATASLAHLMLSELSQGRPMHVLGHSQGAAIVSNALRVVNLVAEGQLGQGQYDGATRQRIAQALADTRVESMGGAATSYPRGPQYVHYLNGSDLITGRIGLDSGAKATQAERAGGADRSTIVRFSHRTLTGLTGHNLRTAYATHYVPFTQARARGAEVRLPLQ